MKSPKLSYQRADQLEGEKRLCCRRRGGNLPDQETHITCAFALLARGEVMAHKVFSLKDGGREEAA